MFILLVLKSRAGWSFKLKQVIYAMDPTLKYNTSNNTVKKLYLKENSSRWHELLKGLVG